MYYPLFLDLTHSHCLIVGGGAVGLRKAQGLMEAAASHVLVLDVHPFDTSWEQLSHSPALRLEQRPFIQEDLQDKSLVFACTGHKELNAHIAALCAEKRIFCNCVDAPRKGNCIVPALAQVKLEGQEKALMAALSTEGASPAWARVLRTELEEWLVPHAPMTIFLGKLRPLVLALEQDTRHNTALFRTLVHSPLRHFLAAKQGPQSEQLLRELLPESLHKYIAELLNDIL